MCTVFKMTLTKFSYKKLLGKQTTNLKANSRLPQGSNLEPLLFLLFIHDLEYILKYSEYLILLADNLKVFKRLQNETYCVKLQIDLDNI